MWVKIHVLDGFGSNSDESVRSRKSVMRPFVKLLRTLIVNTDKEECISVMPEYKYSLMSFAVR